MQRQGLPIVIRLGLLAAVLILGAAVLYTGVGGLGAVVGGIGSTIGGFITGVTATPTPAPVVVVVSDAPSLRQPTEPYSNVPAVDLVVTIPPELIGDTAHRIKVYLALQDQAPAPIQETPLANAPTTVIPVTLTDGVNDFSVSIVGSGGESESSAVVRYVLDTAPPKISITSPKNNGVVNGAAVKITGKTQARTTLLARNEANGLAIAGSAGPDGAFTLSVALTTGVNKIAITATDPAGNAAEAALSVRRGTGKLTVSLVASAYNIQRSKLPETITLSAVLTDPDGRPVADADVTFTLTIPGMGPITAQGKTSATGTASFQTMIHKGAALGSGSATVSVTTAEFGPASDNQPITIVK